MTAPLRENVLSGILFGVALAIVLSLYVTAGFLIRSLSGASTDGPELGSIVAAYWVGGVASGAVVGVLWRLAHRWWGAAIAFGVGSLPFWTAIARVADGGAGWGSTDVIDIGLLAAMTGPVVGIWTWRQNRAKQNQ